MFVEVKHYSATSQSHGWFSTLSIHAGL